MVLRSVAAHRRWTRTPPGKFFLVSCNPEREWNDPAGYGIYLLDVFGNRVPVYAIPRSPVFRPGRWSRGRCRPCWPNGEGGRRSGEGQEATLLLVATYTKGSTACRGER